MAKENGPPLLILGLDVGDPRDIQKWSRAGYLPNIAAVMQKGCWGRIAGTEMCSEQGIWFGMFNGVSRGKHGYYYFRQMKPGTYDLENFTGLATREKPFWANLLPSRKKAALIDIPDACPVPGLPGFQLMDWAIHNILPPAPPSSVPPELIEEVRRLFGPQMVLDERLGHINYQNDVRLYGQFQQRIEKKGALCTQLLAREPVDLFVTVFAETHTGTHQFWKHRPEAPNGNDRPENMLTFAVRDLYQAVDRQIGRILQQMPADANVFIVSGSGMEDHYPSIGLIDSFCRRLGYQATPEPDTSLPLTPLAIARRMLPESLRIRISRHLPRQVQDRLMADIFRNGTDWSRTSAFNIPAHFNSFVRVNLRGREPQGTVREGEETAALLRRIEDDLSQLIDPVTGQSPVAQVLRTSCFSEDGKVHAALPEMVVKWKSCQYFRSKLHHPKAELTQPIPGFFRDSEHSEYGFVAAAGPGISGRGDIGDVALTDLAPSFLNVMGERPGERMTGRAVPALTRQ